MNTEFPHYSKIVKTCAAIIEIFEDQFFVSLTTEHEWRVISDKFLERLNFSVTVIAFDGEHIRIKKPNNSGSLFLINKRYFLILMLVLADANLSFIFVEVGSGIYRRVAF